MSLSATSSSSAAPCSVALRESWPVLAGIAVLYAPTYFHLAANVWSKPESFHGALFFLLVLWMISMRRKTFLTVPGDTRPIVGGAIFATGLFIYVAGRSQNFLLLETLSQVPVLLGALLILRGVPTLRVFWFPITFLLFLA